MVCFRSKGTRKNLRFLLLLVGDVTESMELLDATTRLEKRLNKHKNTASNAV
jgi:hypothetical protein